MAFCTECGAKLDHDARFCGNCGAPVEVEPVDMPKIQPDRTKRTQEYAGKIIKCPHCGEPLGSFAAFCPACGQEIRDAVNSSAVEDFSQQLRTAYDEKEKIAIIRNYPIPNTKEDILEFAILASTNINENLNLDDEVSDAWFAKLGQANQKAQMAFPDQPECERVNTLYDRVKTEVESAKREHASARRMQDFSNIFIATAWMVTIFILTPLCRSYLPRIDGSVIVWIIIFDMLVGVFLIPAISKCESTVPKMLTLAGLVLSIILAIILGLRTMDGELALAILFEAVFGIIIIVRLFRHNRSMQMDAFSVRMMCICIAVCLAAFFIVVAAIAIIAR